MLLIASIVLVVLLTSYCIYYTYRQREQLTCMAGMMIAMTTGMMSSITLGTVLGILLNRDLTLSIIIAVIIGMISGYAAGKPITLMAAMDGLMAGVMGGMMGGMLGVMLLPHSSNFMVVFVDCIFVVIMFILLRLIDEESGAAKKETEQSRKPLIANPLFLIIVLALMGFMAWGKIGHFITDSGYTAESNTQAQIQNEIKGEYQEALIHISPNGYTPENIEIKAGTPTRINFKTEPTVGCLIQIVSKPLGLNQFLEEGKENDVMIDSLEPGVYEYSCGMNMFEGKITVK